MIAAVGREDVAVVTGSTLTHHGTHKSLMADTNLSSEVAYTFRSAGQVLGVSLSGALLQSLLVKHLRERITGLGAAEIIQSIRLAFSSDSPPLAVSDHEPF